MIKKLIHSYEKVLNYKTGLNEGAKLIEVCPIC